MRSSEGEVWEGETKGYLLLRCIAMFYDIFRYISNLFLLLSCTILDITVNGLDKSFIVWIFSDSSSFINS